MNKEIKTAITILENTTGGAFKLGVHSKLQSNVLKAMEQYASQFTAPSVSDKPNNEIGCPCLYLKEPCHPMCTCVHGESSIGCAYCCKYGSIEQRTKRAEILANKFVSDKQGEESKTIKTTFKFYNDNDAPYFGAYKTGSLTNGEPTLMFCMDAILSVIKDGENKTELFQDITLSTLTHEFCHSMQEWLGKEFNELEVEKILGAYNEKWNVFNAEPAESEGTPFMIEELLKAIDVMTASMKKENHLTAYRIGYYGAMDEIRKLFSPYVNWYEAEKENAAAAVSAPVEDWKPVDKDRNNKMPAGVDFLILFDSGEIRRFLEDDHPFAIATHWRPLPAPPTKKPAVEEQK